MTKKVNSLIKNLYIYRRYIFILIIPLLIIFTGGYFYLFGDRYVSTENAYVKVAKTPISPEINGRVIEVTIKDNIRVTEGQKLFVIDKKPFEIAVTRAEANLANIQSEIESMKADYLHKIAELQKTKEEVRFQERKYQRYKQLTQTNVMAMAQYDQSVYERDAAIAAQNAAEQDVLAQKVKLANDPNLPVENHPRYKQALQELEKAKLDLSHVEIYAPTNGVVANVTLEEGEYVNAGTPLFSVVNDNQLWIEANFKETDLTYVRPGQKAEIKIDTYPQEKWEATVISITPATGSEFAILPPQNSSGNWVKVVQRIMVRLELTDYQGNPPLAGGMSSHVIIDTGEQHFFSNLFSFHG
ncbi:MAG: HlyD family secretion protein [Alphaproteobacteria bacterium]|nr:HlyD family secretion protein [Alphaproteobacteria bacterium]